MAVGGTLETALLPGSEAVFAHQPGGPPAAYAEALVLKFARHTRAAIGAVRLGKGRADMRQKYQIFSLAAAGRTAAPSEIATLADTEHIADALNGELFFRRIDKPEPHRRPSLAKKAVAFFRMSRSWAAGSHSRA